jgi:hypothetical protein
MKKNAILLFILFLLCGCSDDSFTIAFTMESVDNYRASVIIDKDAACTVSRQNIYLDKQSDSENISVSSGQLTAEEYSQLKKLIAQSRLFSLKDAYGFDQPAAAANPLDNILYQITYTRGKNVKNISIRPAPANTFPEKFPELIRFLSNCISAKGAVK